jgi:hypothetical protein
MNARSDSLICDFIIIYINYKIKSLGLLVSILQNRLIIVILRQIFLSGRRLLDVRNVPIVQRWHLGQKLPAIERIRIVGCVTPVYLVEFHRFELDVYFGSLIIGHLSPLSEVLRALDFRKIHLFLQLLSVQVIDVRALLRGSQPSQNVWHLPRIIMLINILGKVFVSAYIVLISVLVFDIKFLALDVVGMHDFHNLLVIRQNW